MTEYPAIYHPDIGGYIEIRNELAFKAARVVWDDIAAKYEQPAILLPLKETKAPSSDKREENLAKAVIPSDELKKPEKKADGRKVKDPAKIKNVRIPWTDEEMLVIQDLPSWKDAVAVYQKAFPDKRNKNSVEQQWKKIAAGIVKKRIPAPVGEPETPEPFREPLDITSQYEGDFNRGQKVKMNGSIGSPYYRQIGVVERAPPGQEVMVRFEKGSSWVSKKDLVMA